MRARLVILVGATVCGLSLCSFAAASEIVARDVGGIQLGVLPSGAAVASYVDGGVRRGAVFSGAVNARPPTSGVPQVRFTKRYLSGRTLASYTRQASCAAYTGPQLPFVVASCTASDGSYWVLQRWSRLERNFGGTSAPAELHISHFTGDPAVLELHTDWIYGRYQQVFGRLTYDGQPVHGFGSTRQGSPTDSYGRNVYLDVLSSPAYGPGWHRENSFLAHKPTGTFCYGLYHGHAGKKYRATVIGPGVTPIVSAYVDSPGPFDAQAEQQADALRQQLMAGDRLCRQR